MTELARWKVEETYFGLYDKTETLCTTVSIDNAVTVIKALRKANAGRPFRYTAIKIAKDYKEELDLLDTWVLNKETGELEEGSWYEYTQGVYTYDRKKEKQNDMENL